MANALPLGGEDQVLHACDTPLCVRPDHLFRGTQSDNMRDMVAKGRKRGGAPLGEANPRSRLTAEQVRYVRSRSKSERLLLARELNVSASCIDHVQAGRSWQSLDLE
jgi:hypothetical protein